MQRQHWQVSHVAVSKQWSTYDTKKVKGKNKRKWNFKILEPHKHKDVIGWRKSTRTVKKNIINSKWTTAENTISEEKDNKKEKQGPCYSAICNHVNTRRQSINWKDARQPVEKQDMTNTEGRTQQLRATCICFGSCIQLFVPVWKEINLLHITSLLPGQKITTLPLLSNAVFNLAQVKYLHNIH